MQDKVTPPIFKGPLYLALFHDSRPGQRSLLQWDTSVPTHRFLSWMGFAWNVSDIHTPQLRAVFSTSVDKNYEAIWLIFFKQKENTEIS